MLFRFGVAGRIVARCQELGCELGELPLAEMQAVSPLIGPDIGRSLSIEGSVNSRISAGGTARARVEEALAALEQQLGIHS